MLTQLYANLHSKCKIAYMARGAGLRREGSGRSGHGGQCGCGAGTQTGGRRGPPFHAPWCTSTGA